MGRLVAGARKIVSVASLAGFAPAPNVSAYVAPKHAEVGLSGALAIDLRGTGISVLVVCPGIINAAIVHVSLAASGKSAPQIEKLRTYCDEEGCHPRVARVLGSSALRP